MEYQLIKKGGVNLPLICSVIAFKFGNLTSRPMVDEKPRLTGGALLLLTSGR